APTHPRLAKLVAARPAGGGLPLLAVAVRYYFRRRVEDDPALARGLTVAGLDRLGRDQTAGFDRLERAAADHAGRLAELLGDVRAGVARVEAGVRDVADLMAGQTGQLREIGDAVRQLLDRHHLARREVRPGDSLSVRDEAERAAVKKLVARYRALPEGDRRRVPALLDAVGKLGVVAGDFGAAQADFRRAADLSDDPTAKAECHHNAYQAALERKDWAGAFAEFVAAVKLDPRRFAPFPVGKYQPQRVLGAGGFGVVFLCRHREMEAEVVVKALRLDDLGGDAPAAFAEAQALRRLDHPAVIRVTDCGWADPRAKGRPYLVMDYFPGTTLDEVVREGGPIPAGEAVAVARQIAEGLRAAHRGGVLHRDVKPANVLARRGPGGWQVRVIDFGLAVRPAADRSAGGGRGLTYDSVYRTMVKRAGADTPRRGETLLGGSIAGTLDYAPPEQMGRRADPVGRYSDVYGWARTTCYALFGTPQPVLRHWQSVPGRLAELLGQCLDDDPKTRPQDFGEVLAGLDAPDAVADGDRGTVGRVRAEAEPTRRKPRPAKRSAKTSRLPLVIGGVVAALVLATLTVAFGPSRSATRSSAETVSREAEAASGRPTTPASGPPPATPQPSAPAPAGDQAELPRAEVPPVPPARTDTPLRPIERRPIPAGFTDLLAADRLGKWEADPKTWTVAADGLRPVPGTGDPRTNFRSVLLPTMPTDYLLEFDAALETPADADLRVVVRANGGLQVPVGGGRTGGLYTGLWKPHRVGGLPAGVEADAPFRAGAAVRVSVTVAGTQVRVMVDGKETAAGDFPYLPVSGGLAVANRTSGGGAASLSNLFVKPLPHPEGDQNPMVKFGTKYGEFSVELFRQHAPIAVGNYLAAVREGAYVGTAFGTAKPDWMVRGGTDDPRGQRRRAKAVPRLDPPTGFPHLRGTLAISEHPAGGGATWTQGFMVSLKDNTFVHQPSEPTRFVVGRVVEGMDVLEKIARLKPRTTDDDRPVETVTITSARVVRE
ncbi:MAG: peptidylprolyl isomerase, partial [Gemmataceae bacterium]|nr:peptidylprolyl isomerase [Gemmataceae bacterium]